MKIKLTNEQLSRLEFHVLDKKESKKNNRLKIKFLNGIHEDKFITAHLSDDEYLLLLDRVEENMCHEIYDIYDKLIMQDSKNLVKSFEIPNPII